MEASSALPAGSHPDVLYSAGETMEASSWNEAPLAEGQIMPGKRVQIDDETWRQIDLLAHDQMKTFQELADEAFAGLLKKYQRPVDLKDALRRSAGTTATVHPLRPRQSNKPRRK
jgi:hypothetical protein